MPSPPAPSGGSRAEPTRFDRQVRFAPLGPEGQARLEAARVLLVGCGALGGVLAQTMVRSGVGRLVLVDRDVVEPSNLPRQVLFEDRHATARTPKAEAALEALARIGGPSVVEGHVRHVDAETLPELAEGAALVLDGTDNLETRYLINDWSVERGVPWVYAGVVGSGGLVLAVLPGVGPCLRCVFPEPPPPGSLPTCDTAGVILPAVGAVASLAAGLALRILGSGARPADAPFEPALVELDVWSGSVRRLAVPRDPGCPACARGELPFLHRPGGRDAVVLCGRNTVQIPRGERAPDLGQLATRLAGLAQEVTRLDALLRFRVDDVRITLFRDGRALVEGTEDVPRAQALYDRYVGR